MFWEAALGGVFDLQVYIGCIYMETVRKRVKEVI